ncbi:unnamed protein product, partial [Effrenium voratum]
PLDRRLLAIAAEASLPGAAGTAADASLDLKELARELPEVSVAELVEALRRTGFQPSVQLRVGTGTSG